jgi:ferrous iron transport protein A
VNTNLAKLSPGIPAKVISIVAVGATRRRLMDMGVMPGEAVRVEKVAPLGDPIEVTIKDYRLSLRKAEAEGIAVQVLP